MIILWMHLLGITVYVADSLHSFSEDFVIITSISHITFPIFLCATIGDWCRFSFFIFNSTGNSCALIADSSYACNNYVVDDEENRCGISFQHENVVTNDNGFSCSSFFLSQNNENEWTAKSKNEFVKQICFRFLTSGKNSIDFILRFRKISFDIRLLVRHMMNYRHAQTHLILFIKGIWIFCFFAEDRFLI